MNERTIFNKLDAHLKMGYKKYGKDNIFGVFALEESEGGGLKSICIIIPTFEEICSCIEEKHTTIPLDKDVIYIYDIRSLYMATKNGYDFMINGLKTDYRMVNPLYSHIFNKIFLENKYKIMAGIASGIPAKELLIGLTKVCRLCWNETSNAVRFIKKLTDTEKTALEHMVNVIGDEGYFFQGKEASACGVSRLTYTNLMAKMMDFGVAEVQFLGPKGTYVKILDDTLLDIRGDGYLS